MLSQFYVLRSAFCVHTAPNVRPPPHPLPLLRRARGARCRRHRLEPPVLRPGLPGVLPAMADRPDARCRRRLVRQRADFGRMIMRIATFGLTLLLSLPVIAQSVREVTTVEVVEV